MKKPIIIALVLLSSALGAKAQSNVKTVSQPDSTIKQVPVVVGHHIEYLYSIGGQLQSPEDVQIRILAYAPSAVEYHAAKTDMTWAVASSLGLAAATSAAAIEFIDNSKAAGATLGYVNGEPGFIYPHHSNTGAYIFTGVATAFLISSIINYIHAVKHANKVVPVYNERFQ